MRYLFVMLLSISVNVEAFAIEPPKGKLNGTTYSYAKIGWVFNIPKGWSLRSAAEIARVRGVGKKAFQETLDQDVPIAPIPLLYLHYGKKNAFTSDAQMYDQSPGDYEKIQEQLNAQVQAIYKSKGYKTVNAKTKQNINGVKFIIYSTDIIISSERRKVVVKTALYSALIKNIDFGMSYTCIDKRECNKIRSAISNSTFDH